MYNYSKPPLCGGCGCCPQCTEPSDPCEAICDPMLDIYQVPFSPCKVGFNFNGVTKTFDFGDLVKNCQRAKQTLGDLKNVCYTVDDAPGCSMLMAQKNDCPKGDYGCPPEDCDDCDTTVYVPYKIPDAVDPDEGGCLLEPDEKGYYQVLTKNDCGCPVECNLMPGNGVWHGEIGDDGLGAGIETRDGVWVDADWPSYYGSWNEDFSLGLARRVPDLFGKFDLEVDIFFRFQSLKPDAGENVHVSASLTPYAEGSAYDLLNRPGWVEMFNVTTSTSPAIPWGTGERSGHIKRIVPKGKELMLHANVLLRTLSSFPGQWNTPLDGKRVPPEEAGLNAGLTNNSRFYGVEYYIRPVVSHEVEQQWDDAPDQVNPGAYMPPAS